MVATPLASRVSRKLTRECAPRGSRNSLGNRFTSFFASLHLSSSTLLALSFFLLSSPLTSPPCNPPYAPSGVRTLGFYLFSLITAGGHVGTFHSHSRGCSLRTYTGYGPPRGLPDSLPSPSLFSTQRRSLCSSPPPHCLPRCSTGTPICEHIITDAQGGSGRETGDSGRESREGAKTR